MATVRIGVPRQDGKGAKKRRRSNSKGRTSHSPSASPSPSAADVDLAAIQARLARFEKWQLTVNIGSCLRLL